MRAACAAAGPDFVLSDEEFGVLWRALELGEVPPPLKAPFADADAAQVAALTAEVYRELADREVVSGTDVDTDLVELLRLLGKYRASIEVVGDVGYPFRALAAVGHEAGVLAAQAGGELWITRIEPTALVPAIVGMLPAAGPGPGTPMRVHHSAARAEDDVLEFFADLVEEGPADAATGGLSVLLARRHAVGRFGFSAADHHRSAAVVPWFDTEQGRYLMIAEDGLLTVSSADRVGMERYLSAVLSTVA
ncbi:ESX secretion-associated protein EspG [Amycolatopsis sp. NPDC049868]|uniref:ESX secretion-associated protein EspG n=1 Tax=Amycolatopsis sp. NPDC049868 TaxID=3363934 RepID=UPI0037BD24E5